MTMRKLWFVLAMISITIFSYSHTAYATEFDIEAYSVSEEDRDEFLQELNLKVISDDSRKRAINCLAVDENGNYALAFSNLSECWIYIYDSNNVFQYGYSFTSKGDYGIAFCNSGLAIHFTRPNLFTIFDPTGNCLDIQKISNNTQSLREKDRIFYKTQINSNGKLYTLERDINVGDSYARLVVKDSSGEQHTIYDVSSDLAIQQVLLIGAIPAFFSFVIWGITKKQKGQGDGSVVPE